MGTIWPDANRNSVMEVNSAGPMADAAASNWVDRFAPDTLKPWLRLMRADRPIGAWLLLWPCWWSVALSSRADGDFPDIKLLLLFAIGAFSMRSAGCIYNDIIDRDIDAKVARTQGRPLASGQISLSSAILCAMALSLVGLAVLLQFNPFAIALGFGSVGIVLIYPFMKRVTFWPQAVLGLAFSWGALMGWAAYFESLDLAPIVLYAAAIAWTIGYDTMFLSENDTGPDDSVHSMDGFFILYDPRAPEKHGHLPEQSIMDVAPTLLRRLGLPVPSYMQGKPIDALLD